MKGYSGENLEPASKSYARLCGLPMGKGNLTLSEEWTGDRVGGRWTEWEEGRERKLGFFLKK